MLKRSIVALGLWLLATSIVFADELTSNAGDEASSPETENGGYFELGLGLGFHELGGEDGQPADLTVDLVIAWAYRYNGFFIDASRGSADGLSLGYSFVRSKDWEVDLLVASARGGLSSGKDEFDFANSSEAERNQYLIDRDTFYNGAGVKITRYLGNTVFQYRLVTDIHDGNGILSSARLGYSFQRRNWTFNGVLGAHYLSKKTANYWYGITPEEATTLNPVYSLGSALEYSAEVGATYPISENIVFRSTLRYTQFDKEIAQSTIQDGEYGLVSRASISYVF